MDNFFFDSWFGSVQIIGVELVTEVRDWLVSEALITYDAVTGITDSILPPGWKHGQRLALLAAVNKLKDASSKLIETNVDIFTIDHAHILSEVPLVRLFDDNVPKSTKWRANKKIDFDPFWKKCAFCGADDGVTEAHVVNANPQTEAILASVETQYTTAISTIADKNYLPLCGTLGDGRSCHHHFDTHHICLLYNPLNGTFYLYSPAKHRAECAHLHAKILNLPDRCAPYRRLLVARAYACALRAFDSEMLRLPNLDILRRTTRSSASSAGSNNSELSEAERREHRRQRFADQSSWDQSIEAAARALQLASPSPTRAHSEGLLQILQRRERDARSAQSEPVRRAGAEFPHKAADTRSATTSHAMAGPASAAPHSVKRTAELTSENNINQKKPRP